MPRGHSFGVACQQGASTIEFVVLALAMVPLFLIMPLIGKYLDLSQTTEIASRYVAFEGTIRNTSSSWKTDAELAMEVRRRFFSNSDAPVKTNDAAGNFPAHRNPLWTDHRGAPLLAKFEDDVSVATSIEGKNTPPAAVFAGSFGLPKENFYTGRVTVRPRNITGLAPFDSLGLVISRSTTILADAWTAASPAMVKSRIEDSASFLTPPYPVKLLEVLGNTLGQAPPLVLDPAMDVNNVNPEIVPMDRLK
jgi:hypothetical protein